MTHTMAANLISNIIGNGNHIVSDAATAIGYRNKEGVVSAFAVYKNLGDNKAETIYEGSSLNDATDKYIDAVGILNAIGHATNYHRNKI